MLNNSACLVIKCPDRAGLVAAISNFFAARDVSITRFEQYTDAGRFFARLEWAADQYWTAEQTFLDDLEPLRDELSAEASVHFFDQQQKLGLFVSAEPHALIEVLGKHELGEFGATEICFIAGNSRAAERTAQRYEIPFHYFDTKIQSREQCEAEQLAMIARYEPDCIGLARYMRIFTKEFLDQVACPVVNIHHSFLPSFVGGRPYEMAYERGVKLIGATSHYVIPALDQGPIIEQDVIRIPPGCEVEDMRQMGRDIEKRVFATALKKVLQRKTVIYQNRTIVFR